MRLLFLTETIPYPPDSGGRIKTYNTLRILSKDHDVHCHALVRDEKYLQYEKALANLCSTVTLHFVKRRRIVELATALHSTLTGSPFLVRRHFHRDVFARVVKASEQGRFDAVYCDHLSMMEYGRHLRLPIVLDAHNVEYSIVRRHAGTLGWSPLRLFAEMEWRRLERYERSQYSACRLIFAVSGVDAQTIGLLAGAATPVVPVPISVDLAKMRRQCQVVRDPEILFVGGLQWPPNADAVLHFISDVFPLVKRAVPAARLTVVGRGPDAILRRVGDQPGVQFVGHVEDVERYFEQSRVMVVPIRSGSGMRVKILDGLGRRLPVVTTSIGCEGIDAVAGTHVLVGDTPEEFARLVVEVLGDDTLANGLATRGFELAQQVYDVPAIAGRVLGAFRTAFAS